MLVQIPFSGFYESIHNSLIDDEIDYFFDNNAKLGERLRDSINWHDLLNEYAKGYAESVAHEFNIKMQFESLTSPKYYNFQTDRIFCEISESEVKRIFSETDKHVLTETAKSMFTSRDGFNSFYDPDCLTWGDITDFDHNQLHCLLVAYINNDDFEWSIMEDSICNGFISELVYAHCNDKRIFKVYDYLQNRIARKAA